MTDNHTFTLILGGARSGKSTHAENLAARAGERVLYIATAEAGDADMAARIAAHRAGRPRTWRTVEASQGIAAAVAPVLADFSPAALLVDCWTLLTSNILLANETAATSEIESAVTAEAEALLSLWRAKVPAATLIIVSNEVGLGVVPPTPLGRRYQDILGRANQWLARRADRVLLMVAGLPVTVK